MARRDVVTPSAGTAMFGSGKPIVVASGGSTASHVKVDHAAWRFVRSPTPNAVHENVDCARVSCVVAAGRKSLAANAIDVGSPAMNWVVVVFAATAWTRV